MKPSESSLQDIEIDSIKSGNTAPSDSASTYSIIVPAYNEEAAITQTILNLQYCLEQIEEKGEIIVVDNNSSDNTAEIARGLGVKVVFERRNQIARARNAGAEQAKGDFLFFVDADTTPMPENFSVGISHMKTGKVCGGGSTVRLDKEMGAFVRSLVAISNRTQESKNIALGTFCYCTKASFDGMGGFSEKHYSAEDVLFSRACRNWGEKCQQEFHINNEHPVMTSARKFEHPRRVALQLAISLIPFSTRFKIFSGYWYKRL